MLLPHIARHWNSNSPTRMTNAQFASYDFLFLWYQMRCKWSLSRVTYICRAGCHTYVLAYTYCQTYNISRTLVGNKIVDHSDIVERLAGAAPSSSSFSTEHLASMVWAKIIARRDERHLSFGTYACAYISGLTVSMNTPPHHTHIQLRHTRSFYCLS